MRRWWPILFGVALVVNVAAVELTARFMHISDVPLYNSDRRIGYIPKPNQTGEFLRTHSWAFNELSMGTRRNFAPSQKEDVLLVGDSIVLGGNPLRQDERLGPRLEAITGAVVWPISAGSWALQNELEYLRQHPDVASKVDRIIIISNSGDFVEPSYWRSELTHPRKRPWSAALYAIDRYLLHWSKPSSDPHYRVPRRDLGEDLSTLVKSTSTPIFLILYPTKAELDREHRCSFAPPWYRNMRTVRVTCIGDDPRWTADLYSDDIHPTVKGVQVLASIVKRQAWSTE